MVSGAHSILLAACALFVPFLAGMWNSSKQHLADQTAKYSELAEHRRVPTDRMDQYNLDLAKIGEARVVMAKLGKDMKLPFCVAMAFVFGLAVVSTWSYLVEDIYKAYMPPVLLAAASSMLFILFLIFIVLHMILVQKRMGELDHSKFLL
jgi:hypothetical protein